MRLPIRARFLEFRSRRNLHGVSFAVANMTGLVAHVLDKGSRAAIRESADCSGR